ncbi:MAG: ferrochelatase [Symbiobacteriia bacterium]
MSLLTETTGVLVMAYGTPDRPEDILPYYTDIRRGRPPTPELLAELQARYEAVGGYARLTRITAAQAAGTERLLNAAGDSAHVAGSPPNAAGGRRYKAYVGMKHWTPTIADAVRQMAADGIREAVAVIMAPQGGKMTAGAYYEILDGVLAKLPGPIHFERVESWHQSPDFIAALAGRVTAALARFPEATRQTLPVVFTAHSLPERILAWHDPYPSHLQAVGAAVAERLELGNVHFAYQSAGRTPDPWLGPDIRETLGALAAAGARNVLVCPAGFVADHLEVLYDLDIDLRRQADALGVHFERTESLNDDPLLLAALAGVVRQAVAAKGGEA